MMAPFVCMCVCVRMCVHKLRSSSLVPGTKKLTAQSLARTTFFLPSLVPPPPPHPLTTGKNWIVGLGSTVQFFFFNLYSFFYDQIWILPTARSQPAWEPILVGFEHQLERVLKTFSVALNSFFKLSEERVRYDLRRLKNQLLESYSEKKFVCSYFVLFFMNTTLSNR